MKHAALVLGAAGMAAAAFSAGPPAAAFEREGDRKVLVFSGGQAVPILDPHQRYDFSTRMMQNAVYDALAKYVDSPPKIIPWLAEKWESNADATVWTFTLAKNAKFHNGDPVDAEAVRYSYERGLKLNKGIAWMLKDHLDPAGIEVVDQHTIRFRMKTPFPGFISFAPWWYVVNPRQVKANEVEGDYGQKWLTENAAGSGAFKIKRWDANALMHVEAVPEYWKGWPMGEANRLGGVVYRIIRESAPRLAALQRGEVDFATELTADQYDRLKTTPGMAVPDFPGMTTFTIKMNNAKGPTADVNFRKAVAHAFDYDALIQIHNNAATLMTSPFPNAMGCHIDIADRPKKDLAKAKEYLAKSAYPNGAEIEYIHVQGLEDPRRIGLALLNSLQPLNIKVNITAAPWPTMVQRGAKPETTPDTFSVYVTPVSTDPDVVASQYHPKSLGLYWYTHHYKNDRVADLVDKARLETDQTKRCGMYGEVQQLIAADTPEILGMLANRRWGHRDYVKGFNFSPVRLTGEVDFHTLWIDAK
jgi:peptide/nickel transport system substrate-binding protein